MVRGFPKIWCVQAYIPDRTRKRFLCATRRWTCSLLHIYFDHDLENARGRHANRGLPLPKLVRIAIKLRKEAVRVSHLFYVSKESVSHDVVRCP